MLTVTLDLLFIPQQLIDSHPPVMEPLLFIKHVSVLLHDVLIPLPLHLCLSKLILLVHIVVHDALVYLLHIIIIVITFLHVGIPDSLCSI